MQSVHFVTMTLMSELPAGDTHDVIRHSGQVVAVVVPIEEYQQLRQAMREQQVNEEFDAARAGYLARREAGAIRYVSHEEAGRRWASHRGEPSGQLGDPKPWTRRRASSRRSRRCRGTLGRRRPARR
jgi:hypothetical protein